MTYNDGRFDWAVWDPIDGRNSLPNQVLRMVIHTAVTSSPDIYGPGRGPDDTYAHFYNPLDARIRQHQEIHHKAYADGHANGYAVAVEHQDNAHEMPLSASQIDDDARLFAYLVTHHGLPNRIATVDDTHGLAWHRLGISGNFGAYDPHDRKTWSAAQTGQNWSDSYGKVCPWDTRIDQIDDIYDAAQKYISGHDTDGGSSTGDDDMPTYKATHSDAPQTMPGDSTWRGVHTGEGDNMSFLSGPAYATGVAVLEVDATKGQQLLIRIAQVDTKKGKDTDVVHHSSTTEAYSEGGTTQITVPFTEDVGKPAAGYDARKLRIQLWASGGHPVTIQQGGARFLYWRK